MGIKKIIGIGVLACVGSVASASGVGDVAGFVDAPRLFNDFGSSNLVYNSNFSPAGSSLSIHEDNYGTGGFANRHAAWFGDVTGSSKIDFNYGDGWDIQTNLSVSSSNVGQVEAGFQFDLFGFGIFGVLTGNGEIAAFGSVVPFHSFGAGVYNDGDDVVLRMIHRPGGGENAAPASTMEYMYNNMTTGSGWVSSGQIDFTTTEGGIPSFFDMFAGVGAQINNPAADGSVDVNFSNLTLAVPAPGAMGVLMIAGLGATRRRR